MNGTGFDCAQPVATEAPVAASSTARGKANSRAYELSFEATMIHLPLLEENELKGTGFLIFRIYQ
jgi:hypothetical protein